MPKEKLFTTHASKAGDTFVEAEGGYQCESCEHLEVGEAEMRAHVYEKHGHGPGALVVDEYIRDEANPRNRLRFRCKLCWHPTPSYSQMLFHLRRAHDIRPAPWETSSSLSCRFYDLLGE